MKRLPWLALTLLLAAFARPATAGRDYTHVLAPGETLASLATAYYGASWKAVYISARNGLSGDKDPQPGARLVIPASFLYRVRRGESLATIAKRNLGDLDRYKAIMQENGIRDPGELEPGRELLMPFHLRHTVEPGEGYAQIARRYYRNTHRASFLKEYNGAGDLKPGDRVTVPIFDRATLDPQTRKPTGPKATPAAAAASAPAPDNDEASESVAKASAAPAAEAEPAPSAGSDSAPQASAAQALAPVLPKVPEASPAARRAALAQGTEAYRRGEYELACPALEKLLDAPGFSPSERTTLVSHLGFCAVAAGDRQAARDYFRKWLELDPKAQLDPILTSPKILSVFYQVRESQGDQKVP